ncbi:SGNH/GDSL hydrolase family protein [Thalassotalea sp. PS06]|uniref:SGNH/GDSL hydrolase family protein n=1 Tax=Thalassotalea sp. PS06 TaxID=2594005 RepID=UPI001164E275|nr:SGNH/GDSL hydrolase family protein [Thalassotalea sp. PS06]QDP00819.1 SGNH/GDSL hydrolase family protein [Thalassotalea sp. PS06]
MDGYLSGLALLPILFVQGKQVRRQTPVLPEPGGPRIGVDGNGKPLKLLIVGDSAAAGVGTQQQDTALLGQTLKHLKQSFEVSYQLVARSGATTAETLTVLETLPSQSFDTVITSLGVNDVTSSVTLSTWRQQQAMLRSLLQDKFKAKQAIITKVPPMHRFPALPNPLRWYLGDRAKRFNEVLCQDVELEQRCQLLNLETAEKDIPMASDGFHPGPDIYHRWGKRSAHLIKRFHASPSEEH